ncbi:MAG: hypothetical protein KF767_13525 [Bdellovibrionaceae bacterium]|nr:hypothetical protein [Pseudobdellovibrionaceae bacterium]
MSTLARFRKPKGLLQLVKLIETSEPEKRRQLLSLIAKEDPGWAHMVSVKSLSFEKVAAWPEPVLEKVFDQMPASLLTPLLQMAAPSYVPKLQACVPGRLQKEVDQLFRERRFTRDEKSVALNRLFTNIRELQDQGVLSFATFDPALDIDLRLAG